MSLNISNSSLQGIQNGQQGMNIAAGKIAAAGNFNSTGTSIGENVTEAIVDLKIYSQVTQASIKVFKVEDALMQSLLKVVV